MNCLQWVILPVELFRAVVSVHCSSSSTLTNSLIFSVTIVLQLNFFADDLKIYAKMCSDADVNSLQSALSCVSDWAKNWQLTISIRKCCVLHIGNANVDNAPVFSVDGVALAACNPVRDLGIIVNKSLVPCDHIAKITKTAYQRINLIFHTFQSRDVSHLLRAYCTYVRPILEHNSVIWCPSTLCDIHRIESVQRQFTKRLPGYRDFSYAVRRKLLAIDTLELRRLRFDLIMCYRIVFGRVKLQFSDFFTVAPVMSTRGHPYRLFVNFVRHNTRKNFFSHRVVNYWNYLPAEQVDFSSLTRFKASLYAVDFSKFLKVD
jgi:hypothetical protein